MISLVRLGSILPQLLIFTLVFVLAITNYVPDTYLTGWDNLHPEFNFLSNIKRSLFAVWQEYQGTGLLGGMGHAADLPRQLFLWFLSTFVPFHSIRFFWTMLTLFIGGLGAYKLAQLVLSRSAGTKSLPLSERVQCNSFTHRVMSSMAGVFYILNLSTVQQFYVPFETFTSHFAALPWIIWGAILHLNKPTKKTLAIFFLVAFLSSPAYYVPTLFVVTVLALFVISIAYLLSHKTIRALVGTAQIFITLFVTNAFWLLPFAYFTLTNSQVTVNNKINQMATETIFLENKAHGNLIDVPILRGFWFDKIDPNLEGVFDYLLLPWKEHLQNPFIFVIGYILFGFVVFGAIRQSRERRWQSAGFLGVFLLALTMLLSATPPFSWIGSFLREQVPLFNQAFRFPFTKFSILASLTYAVFFSTGIYWVSRLIFQKWLKTCAWAVALVLVLLFSLPAFRGELFYQNEQVSIPQEYFAIFDFFSKNGKNTRIANFPQASFWGWNYYRWGYGGSGFLWYGIDQPILDRAFDPWSRYSENYYWEASQAIYSEDLVLFEKILEKYQISWVLVDENVTSPTSQKALYYDELEKLLLQSNKVELLKEYGKVKFYKVNLETPVGNFIFGAKTLPSVGPEYLWSELDSANKTLGHYYLDSRPDFYYPFRSLFTGRNLDTPEFNVREEEDKLIFTSTIPQDVQDYSLVTHEFGSELVYIDPDRLEKINYKKPTVFQETGTLSVQFPKVPGYFSRRLFPTDAEAIRACGNPDPTAGQHIAVEKHVLQSFSKNTSCRVSFWIPTLSHNMSYIVKIQSKNISGQPHVFWVENPIGHRADVETYLPRNTEIGTNYVILPPMTFDGIGYTLHFDNRSVGNNPSINELGLVEVYPIPYKFLKNLALVKGSNSQIEYITDLKVSHPNQAVYRLENASGTIVLSQGFDSGWAAYKVSRNIPSFLAPIFGKKIDKHLTVNSWQNGWELDDTSSNLTILYLPQYLEFAGFSFLATTGIVILFKLWNLRLSFSKNGKRC